MSKKRTRGNGEGTIYFNEGKKLWVMQYTLGRTQQGNIKRKTLYGKTRKEVKEKYEKLITEINTNNYVDKSNIIFKELCMVIIEYGYKMNKLSECSFLRKKQTYNQICKHYMANMKIQDIREYDIKDFLSSITNYSNSIISKIYGLVNNTFKKAVRKKLIPYNFLDNKEDFFIPKSKKQDKKIRAFTIEEQRKLIYILTHNDNIKYKYQLLLGLSTGMRMGEINALTIDNIDMNNKVIHINKTITKNQEDKSIIGKTGKTANAIRNVPMEKETFNLLDDYIKNHYKDNKQQLLFYDFRKNDVISTAQVNSYFKRLCEKYNIVGYNVNQHMLRHTFATRQIESGVPAHILKNILGHAKIDTTLDTYTDIFNEYQLKHSLKFYDYLVENNLLIYEEKKRNYLDENDLMKLVLNIKKMYYQRDPKLLKLLTLLYK